MALRPPEPRSLVPESLNLDPCPCASLFPMDTADVLDPAAEPAADPEPDPEAPPAPRPKAEPIHSRFLFVGVAAMRTKQLRRGALPRLDGNPHSSEAHRPDPHKAERIAMEEVRRRLILYEVLPVKEDAG